MHHTFIITANVRGSLAAGRHNLSGCTNKTCTQKHANAARRLSRSAQTHVCLLKGNFVCGCECSAFFLIVWNWDRFLPSAKKSQGESCAALLLLPVTLKCTHVHAGRHAVFKGDCSKDSGHIKRKTLMSFKSNCPPASCAETRRCAHTFQHTVLLPLSLLMVSYSNTVCHSSIAWCLMLKAQEGKRPFLPHPWQFALQK